MTLLYALHGFLGQSRDWNFLHIPPFHTLPIPLFHNEILPFNAWASHFNANVSNDNAEYRALLGYSLGGRLALHAALHNPSLWNALIIVSAHPGLSGEEEKALRLLHDRKWAARFLNDSWDTIVEDWESQPAFNNSLRMHRNEEDFSREVLAEALDTWSLGRQENLTALIAELDIPVLWIAGEHDKKYAALASTIKLKHPFSQVHIVKDAGHRVAWDRPKEFADLTHNFLMSTRSHHVGSRTSTMDNS